MNAGARTGWHRMTRTALVLLLGVGVTLGLGCGGEQASAVEWIPVWSDEFEGPAGAAPDPARWSHEVGGGGWGNQELQFYTDSRDNAALDGAGNLVISARQQVVETRAFTSARLTTRGKFEQTYGRFEARLRLPAGKGLWPAFWLLGSDAAGVGWPERGEIDIVEGRGAHPWRVSGAVHGPGYSGGNALVAAYEAEGRPHLTAAFHLYAVEWEPRVLRFFVDGRQYHTVRSTRLPSSGRWVFDHPFFLIINLAVGGTFGGPPDASTPFPETLSADYVRVYQRKP